MTIGRAMAIHTLFIIRKLGCLTSVIVVIRPSGIVSLDLERTDPSAYFADKSVSYIASFEVTLRPVMSV